MTAIGLLLPHRGWHASEVVDLGIAAERLGFSAVWAAEVAAYDAFALLAAIAVRTEVVQLGTAIVPVTTRTPALIGMGAATLCGLAPGRVTLGIGVSSPSIVENWHGRRFDQPLKTIRDTCRILRQVFAGETTDYHGESLGSTGFTLSCPLDRPPSILVAALGPQMRTLAATLADGVILNFLPRSQAERLARKLRPSRCVTALVRVAVTDGDDVARWRVRRELASYLRQAQYRHWLASVGYADAVAAVSGSGTLDQMARRIPDELVEDVTVMGDAARCRAALSELVDAGVAPIVVPITARDQPDAVVEALRTIAPADWGPSCVQNIGEK